MVARRAGAAPRPVGRPRLEARTTGISPREEILQVAARLFAEVGYENTTMSDIAKAAGLHQSSLYYYFRRKDLILQATLSVNRLPAEFLERIQTEDGSPALKLYRLLRFDTYQLCMSPFDVTEVDRLAEQQPEVLAGFWEDNRRLYDGVCGFVEAGCALGELIDCEPRLVSLGLLSPQEGMQRRYRNQARHAAGSGCAFVYDTYSADEVATLVADMSLRTILRRPATLTRLKRLAADYGDF